MTFALGIIRRESQALQAEKIATELFLSADAIKARISEAGNALTTGAQVKLRNDYLTELTVRVMAATRASRDPLAQAARDIAERSGKAVPAAPPTKIGANYAADFARENAINLDAERAKFAGLAKTESALAFRQLTLGQDASSSARRALHFSLLAGETPESDIRTLAGNMPPQPSDFG